MGPLSGRVDKYRGAMRLGQERIDLASLPVECQRVCACFRRPHLRAAHRANIDDVHDPGIADGHVKMPGLRMQENHVIDIGTMRCAEVVPTEAGAHTLALDRKRSKVYSF